MGTRLSVGFVVLFLFISGIIQLCLCANSGCIQGESQAFLQFKASFYDPSSHPLLSTWEGNDCCQSGRLPRSLGNLTNLCHLDLGFDGYLGWNSLYVDEIDWISQLTPLQHFGMSGVDLGKAHNLFQVLNLLPSLLQIHLNHCNLTNSSFRHHPIILTNLTKIEVLDLSSNALQAPFLDIFQNMTCVNVIHLSFNNLDSLPLWLGKFPNLVELYFQGNRLNGQFPLALQNVSSIQVLDLSSNELKGEAFGTSELYGCTKCNLQILNLGGNEFNDSLPTWLGKLKNLEYLILGSNSFSGPIPSSLGNLSNLRVLDLSSNGLNGTIPHSLGYLANLQILRLYDNHLDGVFPDFLAQIVNLTVLHLCCNSFDGLLPHSIGQFANLKMLSLSNNNFNGAIPTSLGQLLNLQYLYLSSNYFVGVIPTSLSQLVNLTELDLSNNNFDGTIPLSLGQLINIWSLNLSRNNLHGNIPNSFDQLINLFELDLSSNSLNGGFSEINGWSQMQDFHNLHIAYNQITGQLPENIGNVMPNLFSLFLGNNHLNGSIPNSMCKMEYLGNLDLSNNTLSGEIPDCWRYSNRWLEEINLSSNSLSGHIPSTFGNLSSLSWLNLNRNNLQGKIPFSIKNLKKLIILDLGENQLSSGIPPWTGDMFPILQILRLRQNKLNGSIPSQLCQLSVLQILDVAGNNLMGSIPSCIGYLAGMRQKKRPDKASNDSVAEPPWNDNEEVKQDMKGRELEYTKNLKVFSEHGFVRKQFGRFNSRNNSFTHRIAGPTSVTQ